MTGRERRLLEAVAEAVLVTMPVVSVNQVDAHAELLASLRAVHEADGIPAEVLEQARLLVLEDRSKEARRRAMQAEQWRGRSMRSEDGSQRE